jgi:hypothetical protein
MRSRSMVATRGMPADDLTRLPLLRPGEPWRRPSRDMSWAHLLKRVFDGDVEHCPNCEGALMIIAAIEEPAVMGKILIDRSQGGGYSGAW